MLPVKHDGIVQELDVTDARNEQPYPAIMIASVSTWYRQDEISESRSEYNRRTHDEVAPQKQVKGLAPAHGTFLVPAESQIFQDSVVQRSQLGINDLSIGKYQPGVGSSA
jgi:hypothetical protein